MMNCCEILIVLVVSVMLGVCVVLYILGIVGIVVCLFLFVGLQFGWQMMLRIDGMLLLCMWVWLLVDYLQVDCFWLFVVFLYGFGECGIDFDVVLCNGLLLYMFKGDQLFYFFVLVSF